MDPRQVRFPFRLSPSSFPRLPVSFSSALLPQGEIRSLRTREGDVLVLYSIQLDDLSFPAQVESVLTACVQEQKLQAFYPPGSLSQIAQRVAQSGALDRICSSWNMPKELAADLLKLALFDIVIYGQSKQSSTHRMGMRS
jgi:hypothetical protein